MTRVRFQICVSIWAFSLIVFGSRSKIEAHQWDTNSIWQNKDQFLKRAIRIKQEDPILSRRHKFSGGMREDSQAGI